MDSFVSPHRFLQHIFPKILPFVALFFIVTGCAPATHVNQNQSYQPYPHYPQRSSVEQQLRFLTREWQGTPYRMGGTSRRGVDCSGFVMTAYSDLFGIHLPRTTKAQVKTGFSVVQNQLQPGDLVFFRPPYKTRHVGIYLGRGEFAHASSSQGVTVSHLSNSYWRVAYWTARRVIPF